MLFLGMGTFFLINSQTVLGVKGGVNISYVHDNSYYKSKVGGHGGIFINKAINKYWSVQPEVMFSGEGEKYFYGVERSVALNYIQIPLMLQISPIKQIYLEVGPQIGLLVSAKDKAVDLDVYENKKEDFSSAQFSIATGLGIKIVDRISIYGRYNFGLTDVLPYDAFTQRLRVGQVGLAVRLKTL